MKSNGGGIARMDWHNLSYEEKLRERAKILIYAPADFEYQALLKSLAKADPIFFIEAFLFTKDPRKNPATLPFILYPFEKDLVRWLEGRLKEKKTGLAEKSRQMGVTWTVLAWLFSHWLFDDDFVSIIGSRKEELVDKRDKDDTLFYKLDFFRRRMPKWMLPRAFNPVRDRRYMLLVNREKGGVIFGESSNPDFGRGSSISVAFLDEFSTWPDASASWDAISEATPVKIVVSTPRASTFFKTLRFSESMKGNIKTIHWSQHPERDQKWYEKQKEKLSPETLAQEVDISYNVSGRGKVYEEFDMVPIGKYEYNPKLPLYVSWDYGVDDETAIIWAQKDLEKKEVYIIDSYHNNDKLIDFYVPLITGIIPKKDEHLYTTQEKVKIREHRKWKRARHFGDPAGKQRSQVTNTSVIQVLAKYGIYVFTNDRARGFIARREATKMLLRCLCVDERNLYFIEAIQQARYPSRKITSQATAPIARPIHDFTCLEGNTKIRTLKGWIPIKDLINEKELWVWSYSMDEKRLVPALAHSVRLTGKNAPLLEIGLDNGNTIKCTPEHKFMLRSGNWKESQNLKINDSLMPFYEYAKCSYVKVNLNDGTIADEHIFIYHRLKGIPPLDYHVHHLDNNKRNNYPDNLEAISHAEHCSRTHRGKTMKERKQMGKEKYPEISNRKKIYRICLYCGREFLGDYRTSYCSKNCQRRNYKEKNSPQKRIKRNPNYANIIVKAGKDFEERHKHPCVDCGRPCSRRAERCKKCALKVQRKDYNHRIRYIKEAGFGNVYDLTVPQYHNFVAEGVVVHNSHFRSALEYLSVNLKVEGGPARKIDYRKSQIKRTQEEGGLTEEKRDIEKKHHIIRYSIKGY